MKVRLGANAVLFVLRTLLPALALVSFVQLAPGMAKAAADDQKSPSSWMSMSPGERVAALNARWSASASASAAKLVDKAEILAGYNAAADTVQVIATLKTPELPAETEAPDSTNALAALQAGVARVEDDVLAQLDMSRSTVHSRYKNFPCFFASVDSSSMDRLLADPYVVALEPNRQDERHLA